MVLPYICLFLVNRTALYYTQDIKAVHAHCAHATNIYIGIVMKCELHPEVCTNVTCSVKYDFMLGRRGGPARDRLLNTPVPFS